MEFRPLPDVGLNARAYPWNAFIDDCLYWRIARQLDDNGQEQGITVGNTIVGTVQGLKCDQQALPLLPVYLVISHSQ